jgi:hypothetical protein
VQGVDYRTAARDLKAALSDPRALLTALGLKHRGTSTVTFCCPVHNEKNASASIRRGPDGTLQAACHACGWTGDALGLIAVVRGLSTKGTSWPELLACAADIAGIPQLASAIRQGKPAPEYTVAAPAPEPERGYPLPEEVSALWRLGTPPGDDVEVSAYLVRRRIDPDRCPGRAIPKDAQVPRWARYRGDADASQPWTITGHRLILPTFDHIGLWRSLRAICVDPTSKAPKRLPPSGHIAAGLVIANPTAVKMLRSVTQADAIYICEGEPDFLSLCISHPAHAILGVLSGAWTPDFGRRISRGASVQVRTHGDASGDRYFEQVTTTLPSSCSSSRLNIRT